MKRIVLVFMILMIALSCSKPEKPQISEQSVLDLANAYYNNGLYEASANTYLQYLKKYHPDANRQANTYYNIANIYFERMHDYQKALEYYLKIKYLYPDSHLQNELGKRIVNCLERLERSTDAQRMIEQQAALDSSQVHKNRPGAVVATIGNRKITEGDLDYEISRLPVYMQQDLKSRKKKAEFLKQYILQELLYDSAKRKGLDKDKEVIEGIFEAKKSLMAQKLLRDELKDKIHIKPEDVQLYYEAHKDQYTEKDKKGKVVRHKPFSEVRNQVAQDLAMERQQEAYQQIADRLMKAEEVKLFTDRIR